MSHVRDAAGRPEFQNQVPAKAAHLGYGDWRAMSGGASYMERTIFAAIPKPALSAAAARSKLGILERAVLRLVRSYASPRHAKAS